MSLVYIGLLFWGFFEADRNSSLVFPSCGLCWTIGCEGVHVKASCITSHVFVNRQKGCCFCLDTWYPEWNKLLKQIFDPHGGWEKNLPSSNMQIVAFECELMFLHDNYALWCCGDSSSHVKWWWRKHSTRY